jgi:hypothetical protein
VHVLAEVVRHAGALEVADLATLLLHVRVDDLVTVTLDKVGF